MLSPAARFAFTLLELVEIIAIIGVALGFNRTWVQSWQGGGQCQVPSDSDATTRDFALLRSCENGGCPVSIVQVTDVT